MSPQRRSLPATPRRVGLTLIAIATLVGAPAGCGSSDTASPTTTATAAASTTTTAIDVPDAAPTTGPATPSTGVDCGAAQTSLSTVGSLALKSPSELAEALPEVDQAVQVLATQAQAAAVPSSTVQTYVQNQQAQFENLQQALASADRSTAVDAAMQQNAALNTPEVTQAETEIVSALKASCPGLTTP